MKNLLDDLYFKTKTFFAVQKGRLLNEEVGGSEIIAVIVLVAVAVALGLLFKEQIGTFAGNLLKSITGNEGAIESSIPAAGN